MTQTPSPKVTTSPVVGEGGVIPATPENRKFLELVDNTPELSPFNLHRLALSSQQVASNIALRDRLAFVALHTLFSDPLIQEHQSVLAQPLAQENKDNINPNWFGGKWGYVIHCFLFGCKVTYDPRPNFSDHVVKSVPSSAGPDLLVEVQKVNDQNAYTLLGESPADTPVS